MSHIANRALQTSWIALGGNLGDVEASFKAARQSISTHPHCHLISSSQCYQTPAIGPAGQSDYLNAAIEINTHLEPHALLQYLQSLEHEHGRTRTEHWGPRTLDLDIIAYADALLDTKDLCLPHQQMHLRQFVLKPLCDIAPSWHHPTMLLTAAELLNRLLSQGEPALNEGWLW